MCGKIIISIILVLAFYGQGLKAEYVDAKGIRWSSDPNKYVRSKLEKEDELRRDLSKAVIFWLAESNGVAGSRCEEFADQLLNLERPSIDSYFATAEVFYLRGKPQRAISILEDIIAKYPDQIFEMGGNLPVCVVGNFWIAKIAKESGDYEKALVAYQKALELHNFSENGEGFVAGMCIMYMSEIEEQQSKKTNVVLERLERVNEIRAPQKGDVKVSVLFTNILKSWAKYEHARISKGKQEAYKQLMVDNIQVDPDVWIMFVESLSIVNGMDNFPIIWPGELDPRTGVIGKAISDRAIQGPSAIDRMLARVMTAEWLTQKKDLDSAANIYSAMFEEDMYFSPAAGLVLAECKQKMGKDKEAEGILEQVKTKYPRYEAVVTDIKARGYHRGM